MNEASWWDSKNELMVVYIALPEGVDEMVTPNPDGTHTVFISTSLCEEKQRMAFDHAVSHICRQDFEKEDVQEIETGIRGEKT